MSDRQTDIKVKQRETYMAKKADKSRGVKEASREDRGARERAKPEPNPREFLVFICPNSAHSYAVEGYRLAAVRTPLFCRRLWPQRQDDGPHSAPLYGLKASCNEKQAAPGLAFELVEVTG